MSIRIINVGGVNIPFVVSDELYNSDNDGAVGTLTKPNNEPYSDSEAVDLITSWLKSHVPAELFQVPYLYYNGKYKSRTGFTNSLKLAKSLCPNIQPCSINSSDALVYNDYEIGSLMISDKLQPDKYYPYGTFYIRFGNNTRFPIVDTTIGFQDNDYKSAFSFRFRCHVIPESAIDEDGNFNFSSENLYNGLKSFEFGGAYRTYYTHAIFRDLVVYKSPYQTSLEKYNGSPAYIYNPSDGNIYEPGGISGPSGGGGTHNDGTSDNIAGDIPNGTVEANSSAVGLFTRYAMNVGQMQALAEKIYADNFLEKLGLEVTKFLWNSPIDAIISCQSYPFAVTSLVGSSAVNDIKLGAVPTGLSGSALAGSAAQIDWGSIRLEEYWKNFLDYAPHTKIELYLPWSTGFVEIDPHECLPGSIGVVTNIEFGKGTCQHIVTGNKGAVIGVFSGVCATTLPLTSIDTASKAINVVTAAAGLAVAAVTTGVAGAAATGVATGVKAFGAGLTMSSAIKAGAGEFAGSLIPPSNYTPIANTSSGIAARSSIAAFRQPPHVVRNGSFNGNGAGMGIQYPFIILSRPTQNVPKNYGHYYGYPSNIYTTLGSVSGYTEVASVHLDGISCTVQEREEIDNLLKGGVIL